MTAIESIIMPNSELRVPGTSYWAGLRTVGVPVRVKVIVVVVVGRVIVVDNTVVIDVLVAVAVVVAVVAVVVAVVTVRVVFPDAASAFLVLSVASINVTTGGVTTAKRPHCSKKERRSAFRRSSSDT